MRKTAKWALTFTGALLLTGAFALSAFAYTGWVEQADGTMMYLDKDGNRVTEEWVKRGGSECYLDENGVVLKNAFVDYEGRDCYVDETGARAKNKWVSVYNEDDECEQEVDILWYYFDNNGDMVKYDPANPEKKHKINTKPKPDSSYFFDEDGHMLSGWLDVEIDGEITTYFLGDGDDGSMRTEWQYLPLREGTDTNIPGKSYDDNVWYYFEWNGKQVKGAEKKVNGSYYQFDENGVMVTGWYPGINVGDIVDPSGDDEPFGLNRYYSEETGGRVTGWFYACEQDDFDGTGDKFWYYQNKKGEVYNEGGVDADGYMDGAAIAIKHIGNAYYAFDTLGRMVTGLVDTRSDRCSENDELMDDHFVDLVGPVASVVHDFMDGGIFYFEDKDPAKLGQMRTGKVRMDAIPGNVQFYFRKDGSAYIAQLVDNCIYGIDGRLLRGDGRTEIMRVDYDIYARNADEDDEPLIPSGYQFVVSASGKVKKNGTVKIDGTKYKVEDYIITEILE